MNKNLFFQKGFTIIELLVVIAILVIIMAVSVPILGSYRQKTDLAETTEEIVNALRLSQSKTIASEGASKWGVYFDTTTSPHQYTIFKGNNYLDPAREQAFDKVYQIKNSVEIGSIDFSGGATEIVYERMVGTTNQYGNIVLWLKSDPSTSSTIYISNSGEIGLSSSPASDAARIKDSRHVHADYSRNIDTVDEKLVLIFSGTPDVVQEIAIATNMTGGQIEWKGSVTVDGAEQRITVHTHRLNNPDTQFCVHRDLRYNNKPLSITISGDPTGSIIEYSADGQSTTKSSINAEDPQWQ